MSEFIELDVYGLIMNKVFHNVYHFCLRLKCVFAQELTQRDDVDLCVHTFLQNGFFDLVSVIDLRVKRILDNYRFFTVYEVESHLHLALAERLVQTLSRRHEVAENGSQKTNLLILGR